jgi:hypothetical protein
MVLLDRDEMKNRRLEATVKTFIKTANILILHPTTFYRWKEEEMKQK